jgi:hypothetical protein
MARTLSGKFSFLGLNKLYGLVVRFFPGTGASSPDLHTQSYMWLLKFVGEEADRPNLGSTNAKSAIDSVLQDVGLSGIRVDYSYGLLDLNPIHKAYTLLSFEAPPESSKGVRGKNWELVGWTVDRELGPAVVPVALRASSCRSM